jgi:hypothetical protein
MSLHSNPNSPQFLHLQTPQPENQKMDQPPQSLPSPPSVDSNHVYMLAESRAYYEDKDEIPPFLTKYPIRPGPHDSEDGSRAVILDVDELRGLFGDLVTGPSARISPVQYNSRYCFWALNLGSMRIMLKATGQGYWPWMGPEKQFSPKKVARSDQVTRNDPGFSSGLVEKRIVDLCMDCFSMLTMSQENATQRPTKAPTGP